MFRRDVIPLGFLLLDVPAHPLRYELVLRLEVPIQRHLVRACCFGDRLHTNSTNPDATEQIVSGVEDALSRWNAEFARGAHAQLQRSDACLSGACVLRIV